MQLPANLLTYDGTRRRLWIGGQRCHHGATGALLTAGAAVGFAAARWHAGPRRPPRHHRRDPHGARLARPDRLVQAAAGRRD